MTGSNYDWVRNDRKVTPVTTACVTIVTKEGAVKTYCSDAIYGNRHYVTVAGDEESSRIDDVTVEGRHRDGICSLEKYCFHKEFRGEPLRPKCHSEIAALEDLFSIPGEQTANQWADHISDFFKRDNAVERKKLAFVEGNIKGIYVWLYNAKLAPCTAGESRPSRVPCRDFLTQVASKVNENGCSFGIHVRFPGGIMFSQLEQREPGYREVNGADEERNAFRQRSQRRHRKHELANYRESTNIDVNKAVLFAFMLGF